MPARVKKRVKTENESPFGEREFTERSLKPAGEAMMDETARERLARAGLTAEDFAWFDSFGWSDARVPAPGPSDIAAYRRRESALNAVIAPLSYTERGESLEGRLAGAIGARCADAQDRASGDDD
jgi:hypothetical protein